MGCAVGGESAVSAASVFTLFFLTTITMSTAMAINKTRDKNKSKSSGRLGIMMAIMIKVLEILQETRANNFW